MFIFFFLILSYSYYFQSSLLPVGVGGAIMGQVFSTEEELSQAMEPVGSLLYDVMLEGGAVPELGIVHPLLLTNHKEGSESRDRLQEQLQQVHTVVT